MKKQQPKHERKVPKEEPSAGTSGARSLPKEQIEELRQCSKLMVGEVALDRLEGDQWEVTAKDVAPRQFDDLADAIGHAFELEPEATHVRIVV